MYTFFRSGYRVQLKALLFGELEIQGNQTLYWMLFGTVLIWDALFGLLGRLIISSMTAIDTFMIDAPLCRLLIGCP